MSLLFFLKMSLDYADSVNLDIADNVTLTLDNADNVTLYYAYNDNISLDDDNDTHVMKMSLW